MKSHSFHAGNFFKRALDCSDAETFQQLALELFRYQSQHVPVYRDYLRLLKKNPEHISDATQIPHLPVTLFKSHSVISDEKEALFHFSSSGTTGQITSKHFVPDVTLYEESFMSGFRHFYGDPGQYCFLALLPSYLERQGSSLVYMANRLIAESRHHMSGFYLHNYDELRRQLTALSGSESKIFLLGVTYALLDLLEQPLDLSGAIIMETGGMKGKRREMIKEELHQKLKQQSGVAAIHSEYGMTEMLSQAYSKGNGIFQCPPWLRVQIAEIHDPFAKAPEGVTGVVQVTDLANIYSCAFITTQDLGRMHKGGQFEIMGRMDESELRGCNLMADQ